MEKKKINTKNYANLMCFIKMCEKSRIYNFRNGGSMCFPESIDRSD